MWIKHWNMQTNTMKVETMKKTESTKTRRTSKRGQAATADQPVSAVSDPRNASSKRAVSSGSEAARGSTSRRANGQNGSAKAARRSSAAKTYSRSSAARGGARAGTRSSKTDAGRVQSRSSAVRSRRSAPANKADSRTKALEIAMTQIDKQFGKGSVMKMGEKGGMNIESVSTGALGLDMALGIGGLPRGRVTEIFGPESSGKSTLATHVVAEAQREGGICVYGDAEHAVDPAYAKAIGVNIGEMLISQPDTGEQALEITDMLIRSGAIDVVVIDSVAALTPRAELEGDMGDHHVGSQARLMSQALRKLTSNLNKTKTICIFINQLREKIGVMFGSPETTTGGRALKFYSSIRLDIRRIESLKSGTEIVGNRVRVKVVKNKCAPPFRQAEFDIMYGRGISREGSVLDIGVAESIVRKSGAWYTYDGQQLGQGREKAKKFLEDNPDVMKEISELVWKAVTPEPEAEDES